MSSRRAAVLALLLLSCAFLDPAGAQAPDGLPDPGQLRRNPPKNLTPQQQQLLRLMQRQQDQVRRLRERLEAPLLGGMPGGAFPGGFPGAGAENGSAAAARLGARVEAPAAALVEQLDLPKNQGLLLDEIEEGSAAAKAGLKRYDILLELGGKAVPRDLADFANLLDDIKADTPMEAVVLRKGRNERIKGLKLPKAEDASALPPAPFPQPVFPQPPVMPPGVLMPGGAGFGPLGDDGVLTTTFRRNDRFLARHQEGSLTITLTGKAGGGKAKVHEIQVQDFRERGRYKSVTKVPMAYRAKVMELVEVVEKSQARVEVHAP
jgi:hypothetical protein